MTEGSGQRSGWFPANAGRALLCRLQRTWEFPMRWCIGASSCSRRSLKPSLSARQRRRLRRKHHPPRLPSQLRPRSSRFVSSLSLSALSNSVPSQRLVSYMRRMCLHLQQGRGRAFMFSGAATAGRTVGKVMICRAGSRHTEQTRRGRGQVTSNARLSRYPERVEARAGPERWNQG